jgi:hypothetical protein
VRFAFVVVGVELLISPATHDAQYMLSRGGAQQVCTIKSIRRRKIIWKVGVLHSKCLRLPLYTALKAPTLGMSVLVGALLGRPNLVSS